MVSPPTEPQSPTATPTIAQRLYGLETPCVDCGYNLVFARVDGECPECGRPVAESIRATRYSDAYWFMTLRYCSVCMTFLMINAAASRYFLSRVPFYAYGDNIVYPWVVVLQCAGWFFCAGVLREHWPQTALGKPLRTLLILRMSALLCAIIMVTLSLERARMDHLLRNYSYLEVESPLVWIARIPHIEWWLHLLEFGGLTCFVVLQMRLISIASALSGALRVANVARLATSATLVVLLMLLALQAAIGAVWLDYSAIRESRVLSSLLSDWPSYGALSLVTIMWSGLSLIARYAHSRSFTIGRSISA
ncbi:MAG: hypothetical protein JNG88_02030 [Phycisphaerales bacterium]|nr:hypothetical protein [Phycisphaerales bacterium]